MEKIENALRSAKLVILVITPHALERRWMFFEAGGAFFLGARVIPLCIDDVKTDDLPAPLSFLQAYEIAQDAHVHRLDEDIADYIGLSCPKIDPKKLREQLSQSPKPTTPAGGDTGKVLVDSLVNFIKTAHEPLVKEFEFLLQNLQTIPRKMWLKRVEMWIKTKIEEAEQEISSIVTEKTWTSPFVEQAHRKQLRNLKNARDALEAFRILGLQEWTDEVADSLRKQLGAE